MKLKKLLLVLSIITSNVLKAQLSDNELLNRYWVFKDRYLKQFVFVGKDRGNSIPIIKITDQVQKVIDYSTLVEKIYTGKVEFGDAMVDLGQYLAVLATEYDLLKKSGKDLTAVQNELYYAIETINRVDLFAERYFGNTGNLNGFFTRTDVEEGLYRKWEFLNDPVRFQSSDCGSGRYSPSSVRSSYVHDGVGCWTDVNGDYIIEDWYNPVKKESEGQTYMGGKGYGQRDNEQSQDHTFGLLFGLAFVSRFVDNIYVQPVKSGINIDRGFYLLNETKTIVERIIDRLALKKENADGQTDNGLEGFFPYGNQVSKVSADWLVVNPINNKVVYRGPSATQLGFAYPAIKAAAKILGKEKIEWKVDNTMDIWYKKTVSTPILPAVTWPPGALLGGYWVYFKDVKYQFPVKNQELTWWGIFGNSSVLAFFNRNHIFKLGAISGLVDQDDYYDFCTPNRTYFEILNAVFNGNEPIKNKDYYQNILSNTYCDGVRHKNHPPLYTRMDYFATEDFWSFSNHLDDDGHPREGEYNGLDYMLLHNLYRIAFLDNDRSISTQFCPCKSGREFDPQPQIAGGFNNGITNTSVTKDDILFRFPEYKQYSIRVPEWLTQNFIINNGGKLIPQGDLTVCNSVLTIDGGGELSTSDNSINDYYKVITIGRNGTLEILENGILNIENNTMLVVEENAKLIFHAGAKIVLNGSNAILKFDQGQLLLKSGAVFGFNGGVHGRGYVHFHNNWKTSNDPANIICENNTTKFIISGTHSDYSSYANDLILKVTGNVGIVTDWKMKHFIVEKGFVAMGKDSRMSSNAEFTQFRKCVVNVLTNASVDLYNKHNGIQIPGRLNDFTEVDINNCNVGIRYYNRGGQEVLKMNQCMIRNSIIGVDLWGGGFNIAGSQFAAKNKCINTRYGTTISKLRNSMINGGVRAGFTSSSVGVDYASSSNLYAWKNYIKNVGTGFNVLDASARFKCNTMQENSRNLKWVRASYINLYEGYNSFIGSSSTHILGRGDTYFGLVDGYNLFENPTLNNHRFIFDAIISTRSPIFDYSLDGGNNGYGSTLKAFPDPDQNYQLQMIDNSSITYDLILKTTPNLFSSIATTIADNCTEMNEFKSFDYKGTTYTNFNNDQGGASPTQFYSKPFKPVNNTMVKVSDISNDRLGPIIKRNFERILVPTNTTIDTLINEISKVFKLNYQRQDLRDSSNAIDMKIGYDLLTSAFIYSAFKDNGDSSEGMFDKAVPYYPKMDSTFQNLWTQSSDTNNVWSLHRYQIAMDWAQINRIANNKTKAIAILDSGMMLMEDSLYIKGLAGWKCVNQLEIALQADTSLSIDSAILNCECEIQPRLEVDTVSFDSKDTTIHYCHWDVPTLKVSKGYKWTGTTQYLTSVENVRNDYEMFEISDSSEYWFKNGDYKLTYFDSTIGKVNVWNVKIVADTQVITVANNTVSYCDRSHYGKTSYYEYVPFDTLPYYIVNKALNQKMNSNLLKDGDYRIVTYDTNNCSISWNNLTVNADTMVVELLSDTTIIKCSIAKFSDEFIEFLNIDNYPLTIDIDGINLDSLINSDTLSHVLIKINFVDTINCRVMRKKVNINYFQPFVQLFDTTIYRCAEDSAYFLDIESIPIVSLYDHSVYQVYPDSALIFSDSLIMSGVYDISLFDSDNNVLKLLRLNFIDSLVCDTIPGPMMLGVDQTKRLKLNIYPNPANSELYFSLNMKQSILSIKLFDMQGKEVLYKLVTEPESNQFKLDVSELSEGNYIVQLVSDSTVYQQKIQINR